MASRVRTTIRIAGSVAAVSSLDATVGWVAVRSGCCRAARPGKRSPTESYRVGPASAACWGPYRGPYRFLPRGWLVGSLPRGGWGQVESGEQIGLPAALVALSRCAGRQDEIG